MKIKTDTEEIDRIIRLIETENESNINTAIRLLHDLKKPITKTTDLMGNKIGNNG